MSVMLIEVPRPNWNLVQLAAAKAGLDIEPDVPSELDESTSVEIAGPLEKLQWVLSESGKEVALIEVVPMTER